MSRPGIMTFAVDWALKPIIYSSMNSELVDCVYSVSMNGSAVTEKDHGGATDSLIIAEFISCVVEIMSCLKTQDKKQFNHH